MKKQVMPSIEEIPPIVTIMFILIAPFENIARIESVYYVIFGAILFMCLLFQRKVRADVSLCLLGYLLWAYISTSWSTAENPTSSFFTYFVVVIFLYLQIQFDYSQDDYKRIKDAFVIQGMILVVLCLLFGSYRDARFWIGGSTTGVDPNYLSGWFIFPICFCVEKIVDDKIKLLWKILITVEVLFAFYFIMRTASRAGLIANALCIMLAILYSIRDSVRKQPLRAVLLIGVMIGVVAALFRFMPTYTLSRLTKTVSMGDRGRIWNELLGIMRDRFYPYFVGVGFGSVAEMNSFRMTAHNTFLDLFFAEGIIGLLFILAFMYKGIKKNYQLKPYMMVGTISMIVLVFTLSAFTTRFFMLMLFLLGANFDCDASESNSMYLF